MIIITAMAAAMCTGSIAMTIDVAHPEYPVAVKPRNADATVAAVFKPAIALMIVAVAILEHGLAATLIALVILEAHAIIVMAAALVVFGEARLPAMALVAAATIRMGGADLMMSTATATAGLALAAALAVGARLFLMAAAVGPNLLATLALTSVPALFGADRRGDCQRGRAGGKHPFHHGISPS